MRAWQRTALSLPLWVTYSLVSFALTALYLPVIVVLARREAWVARPSKVYSDRRMVLAWRGGWLTWFAGNEEDGVTGAKWYRELHADWPDWKKAIMWSAFRNPANNMRWIRWLNPRLRASRIHYLGAYDTEAAAKSTGRIAWSLSWQGIYAGLYVIVPVRGKFYRFWWGWKIRPRDTAGIAITDYRYPRCGFATQLKRVEA